MAAIIRDKFGRFVFADKVVSIRKHFIKCLLQLVRELPVPKINFSCMQAFHPDILLLGRDVNVDWSLFQVKRQLEPKMRVVEMFRTNPFLNMPAFALCFSKVRSVKTSQIGDLPIAVGQAMFYDCHPQPCSFMKHRVFTQRLSYWFLFCLYDC